MPRSAKETARAIKQQAQADAYIARKKARASSEDRRAEKIKIEGRLAWAQEKLDQAKEYRSFRWTDDELPAVVARLDKAQAAYDEALKEYTCAMAIHKAGLKG
jgi:hypothetical protein